MFQVTASWAKPVSGRHGKHCWHSLWQRARWPTCVGPVRKTTRSSTGVPTCLKLYIYRSANLPEAEKIERVLQQECHLLVVQRGRSLYNDMVRHTKDVCHELGISELTSNTPCSRQIAMHYSFDYAQQVHLPSHPLQPGPIYFLVPQKVGLFGVCCERVPKQGTSWLTKLISYWRGTMRWFRFFTISSRILVSARPKQTFTATTALDKTRTDLSCGIVHGGQSGHVQIK